MNYYNIITLHSEGLEYELVTDSWSLFDVNIYRLSVHSQLHLVIF
jgi:hypothetical protein